MVTAQNYFLKENSLKYCGSSQFKAFLKCPARALAEIKGEWEEEPSAALLVGSYVDAWFEGTLDTFKAEHPDVFKKDGTLKAEYIKADEIIERVSRDELFMKYMGGQKQVIKVGEIEGVPFKIKIDSYHKGKAIVDLKVIKDFEPIYDEDTGVKKDFIQYWGYDIQAAIYQAIEGNNLPFYLACVTKEKEPDIAVIHIPDLWISDAMSVVRHKVGEIDAYKRGDIEPPRCGKCAYSKRTKKLDRVMSANEFFFNSEVEND